MLRQPYYRAERGGGRAAQACQWAKARDLLTSPSFVAIVPSVMVTFHHQKGTGAISITMDISERERDVGGAFECFIDCPLPLKMLLALLGSLNLTGLAMQDYVIA